MRARELLSKRRGIIGACAALALAVCVVAGLHQQSGAPGHEDAPSSLPPCESLAEPGAPISSFASFYDPASAEEFESVMHIEDAQGEPLALDQVPAEDYVGFLFQVADTSAGSGDVAAKMQEAIERGLVTHVRGDVYSVASLDTLAALVDANQVVYVEPNYAIHLIGEVDELETIDGSIAESDVPPVGEGLSAEGDEPASEDTASGYVDEPERELTNEPNAEEQLEAEAQAVEEFAAQRDSDAEEWIAGAVRDAVDDGRVATGDDDYIAYPQATEWPPNDQKYTSGSLWNLDMLNVKGAWEYGLDGTPYVYNGAPLREGDVKVAVIDTGLYGTGTQEVPHEDIDYNQVSDAVNFATEDAGAPDVKGHGTFVSGLIAAQANNAVGVAGAMPGVTIVPCKVFDSTDASTEDVVGAIYYAVDTAHVDVINMSLGGEYNASTLKDACDYAVSQSVLVVASAGNDGVSTPNYPAAYDSVVGVASVNSSKTRSSWSQYGRSVYVTAPGESVTSTYYGASDAYATASGTSFSGPEVAALAAMCKSIYPDIDQEVFKQFLVETSTDLGDEGYDDYYGWGLVNFEAMAARLLESQILPWYHITFEFVDEDGAQMPLENAQIRVSAAADISWDVDAQAGIDEAGQWPQGMPIEAQGDGTYQLHRGLYDYKVVVAGKYTVSGQFKTFAENQVVRVVMPNAHEVTLNAVDSQGNAVEAQLLVTSAQGRLETPKRGGTATQIYDLANGSYTYSAEAEGFEDASGTFMVWEQDKAIDVVLHHADELADVTFSVASGDTPLTSGLTLAVYDASGTSLPVEQGRARLAKGGSYTAIVSKVGFEDCRHEFTLSDEDTQVVDIQMIAAVATVTFNVVDRDGNAVQGARVDVSNADGIAADPRAGSTTSFNLNAGDYTYQITAPGYATVTGHFEVSTESFTINVMLAAYSQTVTFAITDASSGQTIDDAVVKVSESGRQRALPANADGSFSLEPGEYRYTVYKEGYSVASDAFAVAGESLVLSVALSPASSSQSGYAGGSGTEDDPYLIATEEQLRCLAQQTAIVRMGVSDVSSNRQEAVGGCYQLVDDIQLTGEWMPIGNFESSSNYVAFSGVFDGGGHVISGLSINNDLDAQGLFGYVSGATIRNVVVQGNVTTSGSYAGGIVGRAYCSTSAYSSELVNDPTFIQGCGNEAAVTARWSAGGIVGSAYASSSTLPYGISVEECYNSGAIATMGVRATFTDNARAGGIVGGTQQASVQNCYNSGAVDGGYYCGGIVGYGLSSYVATCYNSAIVVQHATASGYGDLVGGVIGEAYNTDLASCYYLKRPDNTRDSFFGKSYGTSAFKGCDGLQHEDMYRTDTFVDRVNLNAVTGVAGSSFVLGRDYPMLSWQVASGAVLAPAPHITVQPQGIDAKDAYIIGAEPQTLVSEVDAVSEGSLTWQWYRAADQAGSEPRAIEGARGTGERAEYAPPTESVGKSCYYVVFTNTVAVDFETDIAQTRSKTATIYVRSVEDAQTPVIKRLNPGQSQDVNLQAQAKVGTDLELLVEAEVTDGGVLSYQWFASTSATSNGAAIADATEAVLLADTSSPQVMYYYVKVTNTLEEGNESTVVSEPVAVTVVPYTIDNYQDLVAFRSIVNNGTSFFGQVVTLKCDIEIPEGVDWEPIGTDDCPFEGTFMGGAGYAGSDPATVSTHRITNMHIDGDAHGNANLGLFGAVNDAQIYGLQVQGVITGSANVHVGMLAGSVRTSSVSSQSSVIANCATLPGSYVEGKYCVGGLSGYGCAVFVNCANHADVHACAYVPTVADRAIGTEGMFSVGGIVGYANNGSISGCYNTGVVEVDALADGRVARYAGGVAGYAGYYSSMVSCFNSGQLSVGTKVETYTGQGTRYAGSAAGYVVYSRCDNVHFVEGTYDRGVDGETFDAAELHSPQFFKTDYFVNMLNEGSGSYGYHQFVKSNDGVPHLIWEDDETEQSQAISSAEPYIYDMEAQDFPYIKATGQASYYQGERGGYLHVFVQSPDGGTLTYQWQERAADSTDESDWVVIEGAEGIVATEGDLADIAPYTFETSQVGSRQIRCWITNKRDDANADPLEESSYIPAITVTVNDAADMFSLADPTVENSAENPWVIETPEQLKMFADVTWGTVRLIAVPDRTFAGQFVQLANDIDISAYPDWQGIAGFAGTFDGCGHTISGLDIDLSNPTGEDAYDRALFSSLAGATLRNLEVQGNVNVQGGGAWNTGGVVAYASYSTIENVVNCANVCGYARVAGVVAYCFKSSVIDCENMGDISINDTARESRYYGNMVGGIVGNLVGASGAGDDFVVSNCYNGGQVLGRVSDGDYEFGAIVGRCDSDTAAVRCCYYLEGSAISVAEASVEGTGVGLNAPIPLADAAGVSQAVLAEDGGRTAWNLNTSAGAAWTSARWGSFARADVGDEGPRTHLLRGTASAVYRVNTASVAIAAKASNDYPAAGESVMLTWQRKPGFAVSSVGYRTVGSDEVVELATGEVNDGSARFTMPDSDVELVVGYEQDPAWRYQVSVRVLYNGEEATSLQGTAQVTFGDGEPDSIAGQPGTVGVSIGEGYQLKSVSAATETGVDVDVQKESGLQYGFQMPAENLVVTVILEDRGAPADEQEPSDQVDVSALHTSHASDEYGSANFVYQTMTLSGSFFGKEIPVMTRELELDSPVGLYQREYTTLQGSHTYTGVDVAALIASVGGTAPADDTPVLFVSSSGATSRCSYGDLSALVYNTYPEGSIQPEARGLPVLLAFGCDGVPYLDGSMHLVFGQVSTDDDNAARELADIVRIAVGDDVNYSQHVYAPYDDMDAISGGVTDDVAGKTTLVVNIYRGEELFQTNRVTLAEIEAAARADWGGVQHGYYTTMLYEDEETATSGPYTDYYEGYDLYKVLQMAGVNYRTSYGTDAMVQFYQCGMYGYDRSWKTVRVSLQYLAGNGSLGAGDYSNNFMTYLDNEEEGEYAPGAGTITGLRPLLLYGKNGLPLVWASGTTGVNGYLYNYRGPMMAFLPQNAVEGGEQVGIATATSCYLGMIDVRLPQASFDIDTTDLVLAISQAQAAVDTANVSSDGSDVSTIDTWVSQWDVDTLIAALSAGKAALGDVDATQESVDEASAALFDALREFESNRKPGAADAPAGEVDRTALQQQLQRAKLIDASTVESPDGSGLDDGLQYLTPEKKRLLAAVMAMAQVTLDNQDVTQEQVDQAALMLQYLNDDMEASVRVAGGSHGGSGGDIAVDRLAVALAVARTMDATTATSENGIGIEQGAKWMPYDQKMLLRTVIAEGASVDESTTDQDERDKEADVVEYIVSLCSDVISAA